MWDCLRAAVLTNPHPERVMLLIHAVTVLTHTPPVRVLRLRPTRMRSMQPAARPHAATRV